MSQDTEYNTGWWTEKPERADRGTGYGSLESRAVRRRRSNVWINSALVVGLSIALVWSVKMLAGW